LWDELLVATKHNGTTRSEQGVMANMQPPAATKASSCSGSLRKKNNARANRSPTCRAEKATIRPIVQAERGGVFSDLVPDAESLCAFIGSPARR
jgi:hypothetical protein